MAIDNFEICDSNVNLGNENNLLNVFGGNVETFESLGIFSAYDAVLEPYCIYLVDRPRKILWHTFFVFSFDFSMASNFERTNFMFCANSHVLS